MTALEKLLPFSHYEIRAAMPLAFVLRWASTGRSLELKLTLLLMALAMGSAAQTAPPKTHLKVGDQAPDFTLNSTAGKPVSLSDYRGKKNVVLAFFPAAFTGG
jgi:hypothetical protein